MNEYCKDFVNYIISTAPKHDKAKLQKDATQKFSLIQDRKVFHNKHFAVRFNYSKSKSDSFSNTVLSLSALEKYDKIPFFVVLVRLKADNLILLANATYLKKISHSSNGLTEMNIRGSFNGSDIMREFNGKSNAPDNFDYLFDIHNGLEWSDNLARLVEATTKIKPISSKFTPTSAELTNIYNSIDRAASFVKSGSFNILNDDLDSRCKKCEREILVASHIENVNIRGRLIESLITADDVERERLIKSITKLEQSLPAYDTKNESGDYNRVFDNDETFTDIKTIVIYLNLVQKHTTSTSF